MSDDIEVWLHEQGYAPDRDAPLYAYLRRWRFNNQFMVMEDEAAMFAASAGLLEYKLTGDVSPEDD